MEIHREVEMDVMIVDDSRVMRQLIRRTLRQAGYDVENLVEADTGAEALTKLETYRPDLVLSDWNMPGMSGLEVLVALREKGNPVQFGFVTSESTVAMRAKASTCGALFLLTKPFGPDAMRHAMSAAGIKPTGGIGGCEGASVASIATTFDAKLICKVIESMIHVPLTAKVGPKLVPAVTPCVAMTWVDDEGAIRYAGFCELALAASFGGALALRPMAWVTEQLKGKALPESLHADLREVFNVLSRTFNDCRSVHVKLQDISIPPTPALLAARAFDSKAVSRIDLLVTAQGFVTGKLSLVSASAPAFIAPSS